MLEMGSAMKEIVVVLKRKGRDIIIRLSFH